VDQAPIRACLNGMPALGPRQVINDVVDWDMHDGTASLRSQWRQAGEVHIVTGADATSAVALTNITVANVVHKVRCDGPSVSYGDALGVVFKKCRWRLAREILGAALRVFLQVPPRKQTLPGSGRVVDLEDGCVQRSRSRRRKTVRAEIVSVSFGKSVVEWELIEIGQDIGVGAGAVRANSIRGAGGIELG